MWVVELKNYLHISETELWGLKPIPTPRLDMYYEMMIRKQARSRIDRVIDTHSDAKKWINELEVFTFDKEKRRRLIKKRAEAGKQAVYQQLSTVLEVKNG